MSFFQLFTKKRHTKGVGKRSPQRDGRWIKVDKTWLTTGLSLAHANEVIHGPTAEFYPDGQLRRLSLFVDGKMSNFHHRLELERGVPCGQVLGDGVLCSFAYGQEEVHVCFENDVDFHTATVCWDDWVRKWIAQICAGARVNVRPEE